jgi:hypothetical protein
MKKGPGGGARTAASTVLDRSPPRHTRATAGLRKNVSAADDGGYGRTRPRQTREVETETTTHLRSVCSRTHCSPALTDPAEPALPAALSAKTSSPDPAVAELLPFTALRLAARQSITWQPVHVHSQGGQRWG